MRKNNDKRYKMIKEHFLYYFLDWKFSYSYSIFYYDKNILFIIIKILKKTFASIYGREIHFAFLSHDISRYMPLSHKIPRSKVMRQSSASI